MKARILQLLVLILAVTFWSCNDQCKETRVTRRLTRVTRSMAEIRKSLKAETPRAMKRPGKLYVKGSYLFINEVKEGIHIIDNSDTSHPRFVSFIGIPGNGDLAIRNNILYADSFSDLVSIDVSDPVNPREVGRVENVFQNGQFDGVWWGFSAVNGVIQDNAIEDYNVDFVTETITTNCEENAVYPSWIGFGSFLDVASFSKSGSSASATSAGNSSGKGGSMARFTLNNNYLYTVSQTNLHVFNISKPETPSNFSSTNIGWNIETIFPYEDKLFIGSSRGMFIFDNSNPAQPKQLSVFQHGNACDPVVVHDNIAYVTLRTGTTCAGTQNQMDLVDVSNGASPKLITTYQMQNPHGLSIDFPALYLCEGEFGLKVFDATDKMAIDKNLVAHFQNIDAYDVISLEKSLLMIGKDGFYQYDASDRKNLRLLSKIPVAK